MQTHSMALRITASVGQSTILVPTEVSQHVTNHAENTRQIESNLMQTGRYSGSVN